MKFNFFILIIALVSFKAIAQDTLKVGYYHSPPFVIEENDQIEGVNYWLWDKISTDNDIPYKLVNMSLENLIEGLDQGNIDLSLIPMTITSTRSKLFDFTTPYFITHSGLLVKKEKGSKEVYGWFNAILNLQFFKALGALVLIVVAFGVLLWLFERRKNKEDFGNIITGIGNGIWWSAVTMTTVGYGDKTPKTPIGRFIGIVWMFVAIMIISGFTGSIASSLTVNNLGSNNFTLIDFKDKNIGVLSGSATEYWLKNNFYSNTNSYTTIEDLLKALKNDEIDALANGKPMLQYLAQQKINKEYQVLDIKFNSQMYAFGYADHLDNELREQIEFSLLKAIDTKDWKLLLQDYKILREEE